jgi:hypothetical protein
MSENDAAEMVDADTDTTDASTVDAEANVETEDFREKWEAQRKVNRDLEAKLKNLSQIEKKFEDRLKEELANQNKSDEEKAVDAARREAREEAQSAFNQRLAKAELKAELAGKVNNLALALKVIDLAEIAVDSNGEVDPQSVTDAIDSALAQYPELKPTTEKKFGGTADQGTKGKATRPQQLTREDIKSLTPEQVVAAEAAGQLDTLLGR